MDSKTTAQCTAAKNKNTASATYANFQVKNNWKSLPTHICAICHAVENSSADIATSEFWICQSCASKLRVLIENTEKIMLGVF